MKFFLVISYDFNFVQAPVVSPAEVLVNSTKKNHLSKAILLLSQVQAFGKKNKKDINSKLLQVRIFGFSYLVE